MDEEAVHPVRPVCFDRAPAFLVRRLDDGRAEPLDGVQLRRRGRVHDEDTARGASHPGGKRHALRGVARADGPDALRELVGRQVSNRVVGAADLERADRLERLEFQEDLEPLALRIGHLQPDERRADGGVIHDSCGCADGVEGDVSGGQRVCTGKSHGSHTVRWPSINPVDYRMPRGRLS
jgi:hypothetical protein